MTDKPGLKMLGKLDFSTTDDYIYYIQRVNEMWSLDLQKCADFTKHIVHCVNTHQGLIDALESCMIGGNHLAHILIKNLGADFCDKYPPDSDHRVVLEALGVGDNYDVWCCWAQIMKARDVREAALLAAKG